MLQSTDVRLFFGGAQNWDINEELPGEVEGPFHVALSTNVLHTGNNLKSAPLSLHTYGACAHLLLASGPTLHD